MKPNLILAPAPSDPPDGLAVVSAPSGGKGKRRARIDWEKAERLYRAGSMSLREIASELGCRHGAIIAKAKRNGWVRDTTVKANALARQRLLTGDDKLVTTNTTAEVSTNSRGQVEAQADRIGAVTAGHLAAAARARGVVDGLLADLGFVAENRGAFQDMAEAVAIEGGTLGAAQRRAAMLAAVSISTHAATVDKLANALKTLVGIERRAYGMDSEEGGKDDAAALFRALVEKAKARTIDVTPR